MIMERCEKVPIRKKPSWYPIWSLLSWEDLSWVNRKECEFFAFCYNGQFRRGADGTLLTYKWWMPPMMVGAGILSQEALQTAGKLSQPNALWDKDEGEEFLLNKLYEDYIREKVHEQLI